MKKMSLRDAVCLGAAAPGAEDLALGALAGPHGEDADDELGGAVGTALGFGAGRMDAASSLRQAAVELVLLRPEMANFGLSAIEKRFQTGLPHPEQQTGIHYGKRQPQSEKRNQEAEEREAQGGASGLPQERLSSRTAQRIIRLELGLTPALELCP